MSEDKKRNIGMSDADRNLHICTYCGQENDPDSQFCKKCGWPLGLSDEEDSEARAGRVRREKEAGSGAAEGAVQDPYATAEFRRLGSTVGEAEREQPRLFTRTELAAAIAEHEKQRQKATDDVYAPFEREEAARQQAAYETAMAAREREAQYAVQTDYAAPRRKKRKWIAVLLGVLLLAAAAGGGYYYYFYLRPVGVDVTKDITSEDLILGGYNGTGTINHDDAALRAKADYPEENDRAKEFMESVTYSVEPDQNLSNGDTVTVTAYYSEDEAQRLHIRVRGAAKDIKLSGYEDPPAEEESTWNWDWLKFWETEDNDRGTPSDEETRGPTQWWPL